MKKLIAGILGALIALTVFTSFTVSAQTYSGNFPEYTLVTNTPTEVNQIADGLRIYINDSTADNPGCKVTFYYKQCGFVNGEPLIRLNVNSDAVNYLQQTLPLDGKSVTFDWDTIMSRANWKQRQGCIREITLTSGAEIVLTGVSVYVPPVISLSAGAPCYDNAVPIRR